MKTILAVVALDKEKVGGGGAPIFIAQDEEELTTLSLLIAKFLGAAVHDLENGVLVIVRH